METSEYFKGAITLEEVKARYISLVLVHHPERGGNASTMQAINAEYMTLLKARDKAETKDSDGKPHVYYYNEGTEQAIVAKINETLSTPELRGITVMLVGTWLWIGNTSRPNAPAMHKLGYSWHAIRKLWYFRTAQNKWRKRGGQGSFEGLKKKYGYEEIQEVK